MKTYIRRQQHKNIKHQDKTGQLFPMSIEVRHIQLIRMGKSILRRWIADNTGRVLANKSWVDIW